MIMVWCLPLLRDGGDFNFKKHKFIGGEAIFLFILWEGTSIYGVVIMVTKRWGRQVSVFFFFKKKIFLGTHSKKIQFLLFSFRD